jgi:hypothetical protein
MTLNNWVPFTQEKQNFPDEVRFINVDTRDFGWILCTEIPSDYVRNTTMDADEKYLITEDGLIDLIKDLKEKTGGEGEWRHLCYKDGSWLKYIWFIRASDTEFAVYDRYKGFINPNTLKDELDFDNEYCKASN